MTIINKKIGKKIRELRLKKELTQEDAAFQSNLDYSYFNQIERGKRNPSVKALERIARALGIKLKDLFD